MSLLAKRLLEPRAILFGMALCHLMVRLAYVSEVETMRRDYLRQGFFPGYHWYPELVLLVPQLLVLMAIALFLNRFWSRTLALLAGGWIVYDVAYRNLLCWAIAHDEPMFSRHLFFNWFSVIARYHPHIVVQFALATAIMIYAGHLLLRQFGQMLRD